MMCNMALCGLAAGRLACFCDQPICSHCMSAERQPGRLWTGACMVSGPSAPFRHRPLPCAPRQLKRQASWVGAA